MIDAATKRIATSSDRIEPVSTPRSQEPSPGPALAQHLRSLTPARIALPRTGTSIATSELLSFQLAHARARDAVHAALEPASLIAAIRNLRLPVTGDILLLHSAASNRTIYLKRPDLGRQLDAASLRQLPEQIKKNSPKTSAHSQNYDLAIVITDGLSALAVERQAIPLLAELIRRLAHAWPECRLAPVCIVEQGRVALGDEIAAALSASIALVLIGERPGLSSPDSLGAYITWNPQPKVTTDAERNCISNIRPEGLSYNEAADRLIYFLREAHHRKLTGVGLKDPDTSAQPALTESSSASSSTDT